MRCEIVVVGDSIGKTKRVEFTILDWVQGNSGQHHVTCNGHLFKLNIIKIAESSYPVVDIWELTTRLRHHGIISHEATILSSAYTCTNVSLFLGKQKFKEAQVDPVVALEDIDA